MRLPYLLPLSCLFYCCGEDPVENQRKFNALRHDVVTGFRQHPDAFAQLTPYYRLCFLKSIAFHGPDSVSLTYTTAPGNDGEVRDIEPQPLGSAEVQAVLARDGLAMDQVQRLYRVLAVLGADRLRLVEAYNAEKGMPQYWMDVRYGPRMNGLTFHYHTFQEPLDSVPSASYEMPTNNNTTGSILDDHTIWYYQ